MYDSIEIIMFSIIWNFPCKNNYVFVKKIMHTKNPEINLKHKMHGMKK